MSRTTSAEIDARVAGLTIPKQFADLVAAHPDRVLLRSMDGAGGWNEHTIADVAGRASDVAAGLLAHGVAPGERVMLMMRNIPDFHWFDLGAQLVFDL